MLLQDGQQSFSGRLTLTGTRPTINKGQPNQQPSLKTQKDKIEYQCQAGMRPTLQLSEPVQMDIEGPAKSGNQKICLLDQLTIFPLAKQNTVEDRPSNVIYRVFSLPKTMDSETQIQKTPRSKLASEQRPRYRTQILPSCFFRSDKNQLSKIPKKHFVEAGRPLFSREKTYCSRCGRLVMSSYINCDYCQRQVNLSFRPFRQSKPTTSFK